MLLHIRINPCALSSLYFRSCAIAIRLCIAWNVELDRMVAILFASVLLVKLKVALEYEKLEIWKQVDLDTLFKSVACIYLL